MKIRRVAILQRQIPHYRIPFFRSLGEVKGVDLVVVHGDAARLGQTDLPFRTHYSPYYDVSVLGFNFWFQPRVLGVVSAYRSETVIAEGTFGILTNLLVGFYCRMKGAKFVWWVCGWDRPGLTPLQCWMKEAYVRVALKSADSFITYSSKAREYVERMGARRRRVYIAFNSVDTHEIFENRELYAREARGLRSSLKLDGKKIILSVGRLLPEKRVDILIRAVCRVRKTLSDVALVIVGEGPARPELEELVRTLALENTTFVGKQVDTVNQYFAMADLFVLPGMGGLSINQAMAFGKPVICSEADGTELDLVEQGVNGYILKSGDTGGLAVALESLLTNEQRTKKMGIESYRIVKEKINLRNMVGKFVSAIDGKA